MALTPIPAGALRVVPSALINPHDFIEVDAQVPVAEVVRVRMPVGPDVRALDWEAPSDGVHHVTGVLRVRVGDLVRRVIPGGAG